VTPPSLPDWFQGIGALIAIPISLWAIWQGRKNKEAISRITNVRGDDLRGSFGFGGRGGDGHYAGAGGSGGDIVSGTFQTKDLPDTLEINVGQGGIGGQHGSSGQDGGDTRIDALGLQAKGGKGGEAGGTPAGSFQSLADNSFLTATYCRNFAYSPHPDILLLAFGSESTINGNPSGAVTSTIAIPWELAKQLREHLVTLIQHPDFTQ
jgi:hypothetical protein